ncbi:MAG: hypothetical protein IKP11_05740 [Paludibacteraceae bacterium]|nr:hypothetical protein [Paludibacteraceae bacterium]
MEIELKDLLSLVTDAVDAGVQKYVRSCDPSADYVKQGEAKRYLQRLGIRPAMLRRWVDGGLLTPVKTGDAQNASVIYSLADIKALVSSIRLKTMTNKSDHDYI